MTPQIALPVLIPLFAGALSLVFWRSPIMQRLVAVAGTAGLLATSVWLLIAVVGGSPPDSPGVQSGQVRPNGTGLVAFDKRTGEVKWAAGDELASYSSPVVATVGRRRLGLPPVKLPPHPPHEAEAIRPGPLRARLMQVRRAKPAPGRRLDARLPFLGGRAWVRHDDHYHVDFGGPAEAGPGPVGDEAPAR